MSPLRTLLKSKGATTRRVAAVSLSVTALAAAAGCGTVASRPSPARAGTTTSSPNASHHVVTSRNTVNSLKGVRVGIAMREVLNGYDRSLEAGAAAAVRAAGGTTITTNANGDYTQQLSDIRSLIHSNVKAIIIGLGDATQLAPVVEQAKAKGIIVVTMSVGAVTPGAIADIGGDEFLGGEMVARTFLQSINYTGNVYAVTVPGAPVLEARLAALEAVASAYPSVHIHVVSTTFSPSDAYNKMRSILAANSSKSSIAGVWVAYDLLGTGPVSAIEQAHRTYIKVGIPGTNAGTSGWKMLFDSASPVVVTGVQDVQAIGSIAGRDVVKALDGQASKISPESWTTNWVATRANAIAALQAQDGRSLSEFHVSAKSWQALYPQNVPVMKIQPTVIPTGG